jgi:hypothetical protein
MQTGGLGLDEKEMNMKSEGPNQGLEWTNLVLGIGLACAALMFTDVPAAAWTAGIIGSLIQLCSAIALDRYCEWAGWSTPTLGSWRPSRSLPAWLWFGTNRNVEARLDRTVCRGDSHYSARRQSQGSSSTKPTAAE